MVAFVLAMFSPGTMAYPPTYPVRASEGTTDNEVGARVAVGPKGQIYVAYFRNTGADGNLYLAVDDNGLYPEGAPVFTRHTLVNDGGAFVYNDWAGYHTVAMLVASNGDIYIAWSDTRDAATNGRDIRIARSTDGGSTFGPSSRVSTTAGANMEVFVEIAMAPNGNIYATWSDSIVGTLDIYFGASTDNGTTWGPSYGVNTDLTVMQAIPSIACDSLGTVYVSWFDQNSLTMLMDISRDGGATWLGNIKVPKTDHQVMYAALYVDVHETLHVAWRDNTNGGIYYTRSFDHGASIAMEVRLDDNVDLTLTKPTIVANDLGEVYVAWFDAPPVPFELKIARSPDWGSTFGREVPLSPDSGIMPTLAAAPDNTIFASYTRDEGAPNGYEAYAIWIDRPTNPVKNLIATPLPAPGSVQLTWDSNSESDLASYLIWDATCNPESPALVATVSPSQTSFDLTGLANGDYVFAITTTTIAGYESSPTYVRFTVGPTVVDMIAALQAQIAALQDSMNGMNTTLQNRIDQLETEISNLQTQLTNVETNLQTRIDQLQNNITNLMSQISTVQTEISNLQTAVANLQTSVSGLQSQVSLLQTFVDGMNATTQNNINALQTNINSMQTQITSLQTSITNMQTTLTSVQTAIDEMNTQLSDDMGTVKDQMATKNDLASTQNLLMILVIVVLIVSILSLVMSMRKPKMRAPESPAPPPQAPPPPQQYPPQQPPYGSA
jgi:predicted  nucleic acid-binding Zn-ribbon protein